MKSLSLSIIALLVCTASAFADSRQPRILLLPFTIINGPGSAWIGDSVEQSLLADLHNIFMAHAAGPATDDSAAIAWLMHNASADYVVLGHVQIVEDQIRLTASLFNSAGTSIGAAKATGDLRHLFDLEDTLADQLRTALSKETASKRPVKTPIPVVQDSGPIRIAPAKALPIGTVPEAYSSTALRDGRDRYIYQVPFYGCCGWGYGCYGLGGFGFGCGGVFNGSYSTGGQHSLAW